MREKFFIRNFENFTYEIVPSEYNLLVDNVIKMMRVGMKVQQNGFNSIDEEKVKKGNYIPGYQYKKGLYDELINNYEEITKANGKQETLKKW